MTRKRVYEEMELADSENGPSLLTKLRNTWEFANLMQYIYIFGKAVKIDEDLDIEDLERECCKPEPSTLLSDIGLALLKYVSSHRGLTPEIFDEYTRRQFVAKAPQRNPFGMEEEPKKFAEFDLFTKLKVLVQLSQWTLNNAERIREKMDERGESEQSMAWRINEIGYDRHDNYYFVLDDNRLYRRTEAPMSPSPASQSKAKTKKGKMAARTSKRRRTREADESGNDADIETPQPEVSISEEQGSAADDGFGGRTWQCVAVTLGQYQDFLESIRKTRDPDEKALYKCVSDDVLPIIEQAEASQFRKKQKQEREILNMQKLATAKRSSRIEAKLEKERQEREVLEAEQKRKDNLAEAHAYQRKQSKMEEDRQSRMMTREQRLKDRELKRILHEEELARMSEEEKKADAGEARLSERHLKAEMEKKKKELAALQDEDEWTFDCSKCGKHGTNWDDGTHSVACEKCNVWQHSACLGISQAEAEKDDFHFICQDCKRREEDAKKPKIPSLKFRLALSSSPPDQKSNMVKPIANEARKRKATELDSQQKLPKKARSSQQVAGIQASPPPHITPARIPNATMNGSPAYLHEHLQHSKDGHQMTPKSPPKTSIHTNGFGPYPSQPNGYGHRPPNQSFQPPPFMVNGYHHTNQYLQRKPSDYQGTYRPPQPASHPQTNSPNHQHIGWSARYIPPKTQSHSPNGPPPADQNPFANTLNGHRPTSSHHPSSSHNHPKISPSPAQNPPVLSPSQYQAPTSSPNARPPSSSATSQINGFHIDHITPSQPVGPPSQSPKKEASPPSSRSSQHMIPPSSPIAHHPTLPAVSRTSPGFSPVKHTLPQQQSASNGRGITTDPVESPIIAKLAPSLVQQNTMTPMETSENGNST